MKASIFEYCKALSTIWGRGYFYLYVGVTGMLSVRGPCKLSSPSFSKYTHARMPFSVHLYDDQGMQGS